MAGEKLLNNPYLAAKFAKILAPHIHTERLMDEWNEEAKAHKEEINVETKERESNGTRRKKRDRQEDRTPKSRGKAAKAGGRHGDGDGERGETDTTRRVHKKQKEKVVMAVEIPDEAQGD